MSDSPRRSARLSQLHQQSSSQSSLASSSSHSSSSSLTAYPSPTGGIVQQDQFRLQFQAQFLGAPQHFNAPLPSPSTDSINPFFSPLATQQTLFPMSQQSQSNTQHSTNQSHQQYSQTASEQSQQQQSAQQHNSVQQQQRPDMQSRSNGSQMPPDFLAEAARRAQIACLMRDMGDVTL